MSSVGGGVGAMASGAAIVVLSVLARRSASFLNDMAASVMDRQGRRRRPPQVYSTQASTVRALRGTFLVFVFFGALVFVLGVVLTILAIASG